MAYIKLCPECEKRSISASKSKWICPHCGKDLSNEPVFSEIRLYEKNMKSNANEDKNIHKFKSAD